MKSQASRRRPFCTIAQDLGALSCQPLWYQERLRLASTLAVLCPINRQSNVFRNVIQVPVLFFPLFSRFNLDANSLNQSLAAKLSRKGHHRLGNILCQRFAPIIPYASSVFVLHTNAHNNCIEKTRFAASATSSLLSGCVSPEHHGTKGCRPSSAPTKAILLQYASRQDCPHGAAFTGAAVEPKPCCSETKRRVAF